MTVVNEWLKFAGEDLAAAEVLLHAEIFNLVLFHSQQCVEKSFKALILSEGKNPPKTHQLSSLVLMVSGLNVEPFRKGYEVLDQIYMPSRYPDALPGTLPDGLPHRNQAMEALQTAREIFNFIQSYLSTPRTGDPPPMMPKLPLTIALIQARMGSKRLPNKVMADLGGRPMLEWVVERTKRAKALDKVAVVTSTNPGDDVIEQFCQQRGYLCFRGDEYDVLDRYYQAAKALSAFIVVRLTGDCPFIDPVLVSRTVQLLWGAFGTTSIAFTPPNDFTANRLPTAWGRTYPIGLDVEVCTFKALEKAWQEAKEPHQREHVMPYIYENNDRFKTLLLNHDINLSHHRWTVDTAEDLEFARQIVARFPDDKFTWLDILALLEREPELAKINAHVEQKTFKDVDER